MALSYHPTVPFSMLRGLFGVVERSGVTRSKLMEAAEIHADELARPEGRLARDRFERTCALAIELTGDCALGVHWAELLMQRGFGPVSEGLMQASSLRHAFMLMARFEMFFTNQASFALIDGPEEASVRLPSDADRPHRVRRFLSELSVAWNVKLIQTLCPDAPVTSVSFAYDAPPYQEAYAPVFGTVARFAQPFTAVSFPRAWLDAPRVEASELHAPLEHGPNGSRAPGNCARRLRQLLVERAPTRLSMADAARALALGERSLRRRLSAEGHSFKEIEALALADVAKQKLLAEQRSIAETAQEMGFSGTIAFHRAFKRWTGRTPSSVRAEQWRFARR